MINLNGIMSPNNHMDRTWGSVIVGTIGIIASSVSAGRNRETAETQYTDQKLIRDQETLKLEKQKFLI